MSLWGLYIPAHPPPAIKWSPVDGFWCSGCQNNRLDERIFMRTIKILFLFRQSALDWVPLYYGAHPNLVYLGNQVTLNFFHALSKFKIKYKANNQISLTNHIKSVHEGVIYHCNQWEYICNYKSNLTWHIRIAHEIVTYNCDQCEHNYTDKYSLIRHYQSIHEGVRYDCNQCKHTATDKGNLTKHIQRVHEAYLHGVLYSWNKCEYNEFHKDN